MKHIFKPVFMAIYLISFCTIQCAEDFTDIQLIQQGIRARPHMLESKPGKTDIKKAIAEYQDFINFQKNHDFSPISTTPTEVMVDKIGQYLSPQDIVNLGKTNKANNEIARMAMRKLDFSASFTKELSVDQINTALRRYAGPQVQEIEFSNLEGTNLAGLDWDLLKKCTGLRILNLSYCHINENSVLVDASSSAAIRSLINLKTLNLSFNNLSAENVHWDVLPSQLETLDLGATQVIARPAGIPLSVVNVIL